MHATRMARRIVLATLAAADGRAPSGRIVTDRSSRTRELLVVAQVAADEITESVINDIVTSKVLVMAKKK